MYLASLCYYWVIFFFFKWTTMRLLLLYLRKDTPSKYGLCGKENRKGGKVSLLVFSRNSLTIRNTWNTSFILEFLVVAVYHKYLNSPLTFSTIISAFNYITMWGQNNYNKSRKGTTFISKFHFSVSTFEYHIKINLTNSCKVWNWSKTIVMIWKLMNYSTMYNAPLYVPNSAHPLSVCFYAQLPPSVHK